MKWQHKTNQNNQVNQATYRRGSFLVALRAEMMKSRHGTPVKLACALTLPFLLMATLMTVRAPELGLQYSPWNYWYALLMPVSITLVATTIAKADTRLGNRAILSSGMPLERIWAAKCTWCLILSLVSNLIVFVIYTVLSLVLPQGAASLPSMFATALALTLVSSWIIPATLFLTMRVGTLSGIFIPLAAQLLLSFSWSLVPLWPVCPPTATIVLPTAFLPVLPTGEPASDGLALVESIAQTGNVVLALIVAGVVTALIAVAGAAWLARSEELR